MNDTDEKLLAEATSGNDAALADLLVRQDGLLRGRLATRVPSRHRGAFDVSDVLQVTYLEAFLRIAQFNGGDLATFRAWLTRAAVNNLSDAIRELERDKRPPRERRVFLSAGEDSCTVLLAALAESGTTPTRHASRNEVRAVIESALADLPPDYAKVVRLYDLECRSIGETAEALDRTPGAVHMLRARAHDRLAELLGSPSGFFSHTA